jgi:REP element-mobilizing transposase RayT
MTQARRKLVDPTQAQFFHLVSRCVRRAWLCGRDRYSNKNFEHRKAWLKKRILELGDIFATGIYAFAVMSNHVHVVLHMHPATANGWSNEDVARRWVRLFPASTPELSTQKVAAIIENPALVTIYRARLADVSWLMKCLSEAIARRANAEDKVKGRFWEGRFKCQLLLSEKAILAAMTYVDLNPVRADIAKGVSSSSFTSVKMRHAQIRKEATQASRQLMPLAGVKSANIPAMTEVEYIELVDFTGREWHPGKRGVIKVNEPPALRKLGLDKDHWTMKVKGVGSSYWRVVGSLEELVEKAKELKQRTLFGIGFARFLKNI